MAKLTDAQATAYLKRLGYNTVPPATFQALDDLIYAHQISIPFETVSIVREGKPSLELGDIFCKVIGKSRGGYCFELNKLFEALLDYLGFDARPALGRAVRGRSGRMPINHRGVVVHLDGTDYSADVGFGGPIPAGALRLEEGPDQIIRGEVFAVVENHSGWFDIVRKTQASLDAWDDTAPIRRQTEMELTTISAEEQDFDLLNDIFSAPGALFREHVLINQRHVDGYCAMRDETLTIRNHGEKEVITVRSEDEFKSTIARYFNLQY